MCNGRHPTVTNVETFNPLRFRAAAVAELSAAGRLMMLQFAGGYLLLPTEELKLLLGCLLR